MDEDIAPVLTGNWYLEKTIEFDSSNVESIRFLKDEKRSELHQFSNDGVYRIIKNDTLEAVGRYTFDAVTLSTIFGADTLQYITILTSELLTLEQIGGQEKVYYFSKNQPI